MSKDVNASLSLSRVPCKSTFACCFCLRWFSGRFPSFDWGCVLLLVFWAITAFACVDFSNAFFALPAIFPPRLATSLLFSIELGAFGFSCREIVFVVNSAN